MKLSRSLTSGFKSKGFAGGMAGGLVLLAIGAAVIAGNAAATQDRIQSLLTSKLIVIDKPGFPKEPAAAHDVPSVPATPPGQAPANVQPPAPSATAPKAIKAPLPGLTEKSPQGLIPIMRGSDKMTAFKAYARPYTRDASLPRIAVVISGYGLRAEYSDKALALPDDVTLLISPYASQIAVWQKKALDAGHELWLEMPMEAGSYGSNDPGPRALSSTLLLKDNETRMNGILAQTTGYAGVAAYLTDTFREEALMVQTLAGQIFKRGLGYLDLNPAAPETIAAQAVRSSAPYLRNTINLADPRFAKDIKAAFDIAESRAREGRSVIILAPPYPAVLDALTTWENSLPSKGIALAPLSALAKPRT